MSTSAGLLLEIWEAVSDTIPNNKREEMARKLVALFSEHGMERDDFLDIKGEDDNLDSAVEALYNGESDHDLDYEEDYE